MKSLKGIPFQNILVRMPNWIGDTVMATPILSDLKKTFPKARLTAMCRAPVGDVLKEDPHVDEIFSFSKMQGLQRRRERRDIIHKIQDGHYDLGVLLTHSLSSAWWMWQGKVTMRLGYEGKGRRPILTKPVPFPEFVDKQHLVYTYKMLLDPLGIPISDSAPTLYLTKEESEAARTLLRSHGIEKGMKVVGINPGASYGSAKCWIPERFHQLTKKLTEEEDVTILFFGDNQTASLARDVCQGLNARVINLAGLTTLRQLMALIDQCDLLITGDSGPMHIADALSTDVIALFGSTNEVVTGPYRGGKVIHKHVSCSPCHQRTCPIDHRCMKQIGVDEVYESARRILKKSKLHITA